MSSCLGWNSHYWVTPAFQEYSFTLLWEDSDGHTRPWQSGGLVWLIRSSEGFPKFCLHALHISQTTYIVQQQPCISFDAQV